MPRVVEVPLDFENLAQLDNGRVNKLLRLHLSRVAADLASRPTDKGKRKVTLEFNVTPIADQDGYIEGARVEIEAKSKVPLFRTKTYEMRVSNSGLLFNRDFPDALDQPALFPSAAAPQSSAPEEEDDEDDEGFED